MNDFDLIARYYDGMKKLVFGHHLTIASRYFLAEIPTGSKALLIGGGSGEDLEVLEAINVDFLEKSKQMLTLAQDRYTMATVQFIHVDFLDWATDTQYDYIICPFFLDVFDEEDLIAAIAKLRSLLTSKGSLIVTDFQQPNTVRQKGLLWVMHRFFRVFASLQSRKLQPIRDQLAGQGFSEVQCTTFAQGFVFTCRMRQNRQSRPDGG